MPHEIVNHILGELVDENGFSTNAIEAKWSIIKRSIRNKMSGKLPAHSDRQKWRLLIGECQAPNLLRALNPSILISEISSLLVSQKSLDSFGLSQNYTTTQHTGTHARAKKELSATTLHTYMSHVYHNNGL